MEIIDDYPMSSDEYQSYAKLYDRFLTPLLRPLRIDIRTFIHYRGYRNIIDMCCGTGDQLQLLERDGMNLVGVDNSVSMLEKARERCSDRVTLHMLDAEQMQAPEEPFDCALLTFSLHEKHATRRNHIFANARKMVRQGGSLIVTDYSGSSEGIKGSLIGRLLMPIIERCAGKTHYQNYLDWHKKGGLEVYLDRHEQTVDVISRPYGGTVLCCSITIDDAGQALRRHIALLNRSLTSTSPGSIHSHDK